MENKTELDKTELKGDDRTKKSHKVLKDDIYLGATRTRRYYSSLIIIIIINQF